MKLSKSKSKYIGVRIDFKTFKKVFENLLVPPRKFRLLLVTVLTVSTSAPGLPVPAKTVIVNESPIVAWPWPPLISLIILLIGNGGVTPEKNACTSKFAILVTKPVWVLLEKVFDPWILLNVKGIPLVKLSAILVP